MTSVGDAAALVEVSRPLGQSIPTRHTIAAIEALLGLYP